MADDLELDTPLVGNNDSVPDTTIPRNHKRDVHILSWAFLLIFLAYGAAQNLESTINSAEDLGTISLGVLYLSFSFFSLIASLLVRKIGPKNALILGTSGYWLFIAANLMPTWYTMMPASVYLGFAASIIWVSQGTYLTSTACSHADDYSLPEGAVIGKFNGEFWGMFALHQLVGNLISLALLRDGKEGRSSGTTPLFIVFLCTMTVGTVLMCFLSKRSSKEEKRIDDSSMSFYASVLSLCKAFVKLLLDKRILLVIPLIAYSGLQQAFVWSDFTKHVVKPALGEPGVGGVMAVYGAFDAIGSLIAGRLTSGLSSITILVSAGALIQAFGLVFLLLKVSISGEVLVVLYPLFIAILLSIGDAVFNTQLSALLGILFKHNLEGAFAQLKLWQSLSNAIVALISPYISMQLMIVIMLVVLCISMASFLFLALKVEATFRRNPASL